MSPDLERQGSVEIFCSYSHKDQAIRKKFDPIVEGLKNHQLVQIWHDGQIVAGSDWEKEINQHLESADIITFLVSADFLASNFCRTKEMVRAMQRQSEGAVVIVPIIARPCDWEEEEFHRFQVLPKAGKPITTFKNMDLAWTDISKSLKMTIRRVLTTKLKQIDSLVTVNPPPAPSMAGIFPPMPLHLPMQGKLDQVQGDQELAREIYTKIMRDADTNRAERFRIQKELQDRIFAITKEIGPPPLAAKKRADEAFNNMDDYIRQ